MRSAIFTHRNHCPNQSHVLFILMMESVIVRIKDTHFPCIHMFGVIHLTSLKFSDLPSSLLNAHHMVLDINDSIPPPIGDDINLSNNNPIVPPLIPQVHESNENAITPFVPVISFPHHEDIIVTSLII
eukprot:1060654_1